MLVASNPILQKPERTPKLNEIPVPISSLKRELGKVEPGFIWIATWAGVVLGVKASKGPVLT